MAKIVAASPPLKRSITLFVRTATERRGYSNSAIWTAFGAAKMHSPRSVEALVDVIACQNISNGIAFRLQCAQKSGVSITNKTDWPRRPRRLSRLFDTVRPFYFLTFNTYERQPILARTEVNEAFCMFCLKAQEHDVAVGRYVIMPDHVHLFATLPFGGIALPNWIQSLRAVIGKRLLRLEIPKPHWQEGFFDHLLRSHESYAQKWDYVRLNPVRAKLSKTPEAWPYQGEIVPIRFG